MLKLCINYFRFVVLGIVIIAPRGYIYAQEGPSPKELANDYIKMAEDVLADLEAMDQARELYVLAANTDPANVVANYKAGEYHLLTIDKGQASGYFLKVKQLDEDYRFDIDYQIGIGYQYGSDFKNALTHFNLYKQKLKANDGYRGLDMVSLTEVDRRIQECNNALEFMANPSHVNITNVGNAVNSEFEDFGPVLNEAEDFLVFTTRRKDGNLNENVDQDLKPYEDIFFARKQGDRWGYASNIGHSINSRFHNSALAISADGNMLFIYSTDNNGDILISERQDNDTIWSEPLSISPNINSRGFQESSVSISEDGNVLFFSSDRPGGQGETDIYYSVKQEGEWARARNVGEVINTKFKEDGPFIDYDGKTLYFSSQGHKGMGQYDIFRSVYDSASQTWSEPENLGYPINTPDHDIYFVSTKDGKRGYYASVREDGYGFTDIYMVTLPDPNKDLTKVDPVKDVQMGPEDTPPDTDIEVKEQKMPNQPVTLTIQVVDGSTGQELEASVNLKNAGNGSPVSLEAVGPGEYKYVSQSETSLSLMLSAEHAGYVFENVSLQLPGMSEKPQAINRTIRMRKAVVNTSKVLRNIYFDFDKVTLKEESFNELGMLERMMSENAGMRIEISGHTDKIGEAEYNKSLSQNRANSVMKYLISKGVDTSRITAVGYGEEKPLASNDDEAEGRELNRRVEFKIISQ